MNEHDTVIMYRSRMDAAVDDYWWDLFQQYPNFFAWLLAAIIVFVLACIVAIKWPRKRKPKDWRF